jgi:hypothetical protein
MEVPHILMAAHSRQLMAAIIVLVLALKSFVRKIHARPQSSVHTVESNGTMVKLFGLWMNAITVPVLTEL